MANLVLAVYAGEECNAMGNSQLYQLTNGWDSAVLLKSSNSKILLSIGVINSTLNEIRNDKSDIIIKWDLSAVEHLLEIVNCSSVQTEARVIYKGFLSLKQDVDHVGAIDFIVRSVCQLIEIQHTQVNLISNKYITLKKGIGIGNDNSPQKNR